MHKSNNFMNAIFERVHAESGHSNEVNIMTIIKMCNKSVFEARKPASSLL